MRRGSFWGAVALAAAMCAAAPSLMGADFALLNSDVNTAAYFTNAYEPFKCNPGDWNLGRNEYQRYWMGWEFVLRETGKSYEIIKDADINPGRLADFKVLILSNNFWLDNYQTKVIAEWVRRGGRLLATFGTGYQGIEGDFVKGGTNGLHQLWGDPSNKVKSSYLLGNPWVKVRITNNGGPTTGYAVGDVLDYQYMANILIQRPESSRDINAFFLFNDAVTRQPAMFNNRHSQGLVVYYAFAPEYLVSMAFDVAGHCVTDTRYPGGDPAPGIQGADSPNGFSPIATGLKELMKKTLDYLETQ